MSLTGRFASRYRETTTGAPEALNLLRRVAVRLADFKPGDEGYRHRQLAEDELMRAWSYFDPGLYAEKVISALGVSKVTVQDPQVLSGIAELPWLSTLSCRA